MFLFADFVLLNLDFFFHVYLFALWVVEYIFEESEFLARYNFNAKSILHLPLAFQGYEALIDVGGDVWVDV